MARRKGSSWSRTRSLLYGFARTIGDMEALGKGPEALARRLLRRAVGKATGRLFSKLFR